MQNSFKYLLIILLLSLYSNIKANSGNKRDTTDKAKIEQSSKKKESSDLNIHTLSDNDSAKVYIHNGKKHFLFVLKDTTINHVDSSLVKRIFSLLVLDKKSKNIANKTSQTDQEPIKKYTIFIESYWWAFLLLFILLLLLSWNLSSYLNQKRFLKSVSTKTNSNFFTQDDIANEIISLKGNLSFEEKKHRESLESIRKERDEAIRNLENDKKPQEKDKSSTLPSVHVIPPSLPVVETNTFYFSSAVRNGSSGFFVDDNKTFTKLEDSQFKFEVSNSKPNVATFRFDAASSNFQSILGYRSYKLEPVCKSINLFEADFHTRIVHIENGRAILENGKWIVRDVDKAKIRYE